MKKNAIIWRESVYHNDFKCKCGKVLFANNNVVEDVLYDTENDLLICPKCLKVVAKITTEKEAIKTAFRGEEA